MNGVNNWESMDKLKLISQYPTTLILKIFENVSEGIMITDEYKKIVMVNPAFEFVTGYKRDDVVGKTPAVLQSGVHELPFYLEMWEQIRQEGIWQGEIWNRRKTGDVYPEWLTIVCVTNDEGEVTNYCGIFTDLSERKIVENELEKRLLTDSLTEVSNRFAYIERMDNLLESTSAISHSVQHAVYFLDLDRFKQINDTLGHAVGDSILIEVAKRLKHLLKNKDIIARYGGDEFVITLTNVKNVKEAAQFAEQIISSIEKPMMINGQEVFISTSIGVSVYPVDGKNTEELINCADRAMTYSKKNGLNGYSFYFDELQTDAQRVLLLDSELRRAIDNREFELHFQPKIYMDNEQIQGLEALVRWNNERLGFVSPGEFIPYAEETGLIIPLSEVILEKACEAVIQMQQYGWKIPVAINISSIHFRQQNFLESIQAILERYNMPANNFEIEVTERTVMNSANETVSKLVRLKQLGFKISIDDFGTGYSSLSYLVRFPLDCLKIDRSFIQHIGSLDEKQAVVDAIIQMSHRLKMKVVAEGVEQAQQVDILRKMNCDIIQGYYYSKPLPLNDLMEFMEYWEIEHQGRK
ncbi:MULTISPECIES: putative bifunctional diguanylate cyclase/phosphodiesterase [Lysinibacillus]|uniref:Diguanylate cyclase/phosphodiesterase with PAS/PAC sensor(S) n=1 Tax=Lysinibacillus fusiformis TaxID=28031 RepID=A0A1H8YYL0_9BACI|nr:GGDEF domain-containing phosphodiesterase [Lysinibacillus fusiformis]MCG7434581.1 EAL domain-containing protein [Lysinibacillus fusiformis]NOG27028.1 EAL domain-containing protein [Lysinibacillus fusiformis]SCX94585.1 diguanylate cyclase/phosphodiesterase with PAS/PAC sensor(s) [Lysinibacillus fusiformis]SEM92959.1 diguanylate cyclase/phosphodiesterase with PAS/PAC sensor(s) [Lysinibacillus fusiformis]SEP57192.1 diguanylate cyclase/phosphodiesterase with PAS/PAC sensor(s) [Lysinibacillus fu